MKNLNIQSLKSRQPVKVFQDQDERTNTGQCAEQALFGFNIQDEQVRIVFVQFKCEKSDYQLTGCTEAGCKRKRTIRTEAQNTN